MTGPGAGDAGRPERIGRYRVREVIGAGAFATVYRAHDDRLDADVAVKVLADNHSLDPDVRERFLHEGRLLRRARSTHLVTVHDLGETDRAQPYLVLEWADGGDLATRLGERRVEGRAPAPADGLVLARALAAALGSLHAIQVVHRDLTPRNLLLRSHREPSATTVVPPASTSPRGDEPVRPASPAALPGAGPSRDPGDARVFGDGEQVLVADLGLAKDLARASGLTLATGTSGFAAPEQRASGAPVDHRADVWAASAVLVWLATGHSPDDRGWRVLAGGAGWPAELVPVLERGLAPSADARYGGIGEWLAAVEGALRPVARSHDLAGPSRSERRPGSPDGGVAAARVTGRTVVVAAAVALAVGGGAGYGLAPAARPDRPEVTAESLAGGRERTVTEAHGVTITVEGPTEVAVGEEASLTATVEGAGSWAWVAPDGTMHPGAAVLEVVATGPGRLTVRLVASDARGRLVEAEHTTRVVES